MGNREKLLAGAVQCLQEKGYAQTTARDIAAAAGVSLAAIGYHFGSTEGLLGAALQQAMADWGDELERALRADEAVPGRSPAATFAGIWDRVIASVSTHRSLWSTQFELVTQLDRQPQLRAEFLGSQQQARFGLAALFADIDPDHDPDAAELVGTFYQALLTGVVVQHLIDPEHAPSGHDLARALRTVASRPPGRDA